MRPHHHAFVSICQGPTSVSSVLRPEYVSERSASAACTAAAMRSCARRRRRPESRLARGAPVGVLAGEAALSCRCAFGVNDWPPASEGSHWHVRASPCSQGACQAQAQPDVLWREGPSGGFMTGRGAAPFCCAGSFNGWRPLAMRNALSVCLGVCLGLTGGSFGTAVLTLAATGLQLQCAPLVLLGRSSWSRALDAWPAQQHSAL